MSVDFYNCDICGEIYDDCGGLYDVCEECGTRICYYCQVDLGMRTKPDYFDEGAELLGEYWDRNDKYPLLTSCPHCKKEIIDNDTILSYLLKKYNLDKEEIITEIKKITN